MRLAAGDDTDGAPLGPGRAHVIPMPGNAALDHFESDFRDVLRAQPFQDRAALKRDGQRTKFWH